jgi:8-oxo-dGTP pyrophosphatase MutT (NUDIX family)
MAATTPDLQTPRLAATLILYRSVSPWYEVYLLRRSTKSGFMAGNWVFPGGTLDDSDYDADFWRSHIDLDQQVIEARFGWGDSPETTLAHLIAAARETFEEAGVLPTDRKESTQVVENAVAFQAESREKVDAFPDLVQKFSWVINLSEIHPWAHWITPERMPRRYDTRFFITALSSWQTCRPDPHETPEGLWISPRKALEENWSRRLPLSPPTLVTLHQMLACETVSALEGELEHPNWGSTIMPRLEPLEKGAMLIEPWDPEYRAESPSRIPGRLLKVGHPFSRLWRTNGFWLPVDLPGV